ncbi:hypothetical protein KKB44_00410 [Candidatus Micrarchaeota archaeon]|nr:hypothetical protein [Candidatus Micrarchaeota archaeon]
MKAIWIFLILTFVSFAQINSTPILTDQEYPHPLYSSYFINGQENTTTYTFRVYNNYTNITSPFMLWLESNFSWFDPDTFYYHVEPDGFVGKYHWPYWEIPSLYPNETAEISFRVNRSVGLAESILVNGEEIDRWRKTCEIPPYNGTDDSAETIYTFLDSLNKTQNLSIYYETETHSLVYLHTYGSFVVFEINESVSAVSDKEIVSQIVLEYIDSVTPESSANVSRLYDMLKYSKQLKATPERECLMLTGMDRFPCVDRETCLYACFSVPVCSYIGQSGWSFMDTMLDYKNNLDLTNFALDQAINSSRTFSQNPSYENAQLAFEDVINLNRNESKMIQHPLFTSYGFCEPPQYGLVYQMDGRRHLLDYMETNCLYGKEEMIINESIHLASKIFSPPEPIYIPLPNVTIVTPNQTIIYEEQSSACCWTLICSLVGVERVAGYCWEWPVIITIFFLSLLSIIVIGHHRRKNSKL